MKRILAVMIMLLCVPGKGMAQINNVVSCDDAESAQSSGNTTALESYATQLYENWDDQAQASGQSTVMASKMNIDSAISFAMRICNGNPQGTFEDALRASFQFDQRLGSL